MRVYLKGFNRYPKRLDDFVLVYHNQGEICFTRKKADFQVKERHLTFKERQTHLITLWKMIPVNIKNTLALYAKEMKYYQRRSQGISAFSVFIRMMYQFQSMSQTEICLIDYTVLCQYFKTYRTLKQLIEAGFLKVLSGLKSFWNKSLHFDDSGDVKIEDADREINLLHKSLCENNNSGGMPDS